MADSDSLRTINMLTLVVSVYNEEDALLDFWKEVSSVAQSLACEVEIIFVNDGSVDNSRKIIDELAAEHQTVRALHFSRNFGHEAAMLAGIDKSQGDAVICLDADCQHPPSIIPKMVEEFQKGSDVVNMVRTFREDVGFVKRGLSKLFYKMLNKLSPVKFHESASDFFLVSRAVAKVLKNEYRERTRFLRGFIQILGFQNSTLEFEATNRIAGESKYSLYKLFVLSIGAIISFSKVPLHLGLIIGTIFSFVALALAVYSVVFYLIDDVPPGYTTLVVFLAFSFALTFFLIGIIGVYVGYMFDESKKRPIYIIEEEK